MKNFVKFVFIFMANIVVAFTMATVKVGNGVKLFESMRGPAYLIGTVLGIALAIGWLSIIHPFLKVPYLMGAVESIDEYDPVAFVKDEGSIIKQFSASMLLGVGKLIALALPFVGSLAAYAYAGGVTTGYEGIAILMLWAETFVFVCIHVYGALKAIISGAAMMQRTASRR